MTPHANSPTRLDHSCTTDINGSPDLEQRAYGMTGVERSCPSCPVPPGNQSHLTHTSEDVLHDLVCVGFGPASLAIAVALHDAMDGQGSPSELRGMLGKEPKVAFLERQRQFAWHAGMLLPGAKMQITFMKDMATLRNPRSEFTFINYLHKNNRLVQFTNLNTFLPQRIEYEDYMRWCAGWFDDVVDYNQEVLQIVPEKSAASNGKIDTFVVMSRDGESGQVKARRTKHVVIAAGGRPNIPKPFPNRHPRIIHSSQFSHVSRKLFSDPEYPYKIAVVGSGQSAAEIFDFCHSHYPNARTNLLIKGGALRPSDDSPFVNEIFNPDKIDGTFSRAADLRAATIAEDRGTNYGVVRLELLERLYETLYTQRIPYGNTPDAQNQWPHRILPYRSILHIEDSHMIPEGVRLHLMDSSPMYYTSPTSNAVEEVLDVDVVFVATGYKRDLHRTLLEDAQNLVHDDWAVSRDYKLLFKEGKLSDDAGIWLQGCCESTHGLSDTLLSVLATRGGQIVDSIFGKEFGSDVFAASACADMP